MAELATLAVLAFGHEDLELQIARVGALIAASPEDGSLYLRRAELHRLHRDRGAAVADYEAARRLDPDLARVDLGLGRLELAEGRPAKAVEHLDAYVTRSPSDPAGRIERARAHAAGGAPLRALEDYDAALSLSVGTGPDVHLERIRVLRSMGPEKHDAAMRALDEATGRLGPLVVLLSEAVDAEAAAGRLEQALQRVDAAAAAGGRTERWLLRRGEILERMGRPEGARTAYAAALREIENLPPARRRTREAMTLESALRDRLASILTMGDKR